MIGEYSYISYNSVDYVAGRQHHEGSALPKLVKALDDLKVPPPTRPAGARKTEKEKLNKVSPRATPALVESGSGAKPFQLAQRAKALLGNSSFH